MPTHYHFLFWVKEPEGEKSGENEVSEDEKASEVSETSEGSSIPTQSAVSEAMRRFSISYSKAINKRFDRVGSLFQGAYQAKHVAEESYLVSLSRYVHLNPVAAGLVESPAAWRFSSYRDFIGERAGRLPCSDIVLSSFASQDAYRRFVEDATRPSEGAEWQEALFEQ